MRFIPEVNDRYQENLAKFGPAFLKGVEHWMTSFNDIGMVEPNKWMKEDPSLVPQQLLDSKGDLMCEVIFKDTEYSPGDSTVLVDDFLKPIIRLPKPGKLISEFAEEASDVLKNKNKLFYRSDTKEVVEISKIKTQEDEETIYDGFLSVKPKRLITISEKFFIPGYDEWNKEKRQIIFQKKSMTSELAGIILLSEQMQEALPQINRIFTCPIPIKYKDKLTFPETGYDKRFGSWLPLDSPQISKPKMKIDEAKEIIDNLLKEFCFESSQDKTNAVAALLTPFLRGLFPKFTTRAPVFFYIANRERAGKDYLAGITGIVYEGFALEESPVNSSESNMNNNTDELRKKILAAMIHGRKRLHFANNKGYINNAVFEAITTTEKHSDRVLGRSEVLTFDNEIDFSLSGNVGVGFTPDFANRCRFIRLFLDIEDANARTFDNPNLHIWVLQHREEILSALYSLVTNWINKGEPGGEVPFSSFPEWARICGGVMQAAGYDSPCIADKDTLALGGDDETTDMKYLFELMYENFPDQWKTKQEIRSFIESGESDLFAYMDFTKRPDQIKFANKLTKFKGRVLSDIRLISDDNARASRQRMKFEKLTKEDIQ